MIEACDPKVSRVVEFLQSHPTNRMSVEEAAALAGVSSTYFPILFRRCTGLPYSTYVVRARMEHAQYLLVNTNMPIKEIAYTLGYSDSFLFSRQFKEHTGTAPTDWRQRELTSSLKEARICFEQGVAELACQRVSDNDFHILQQMVAQMGHTTSWTEALALDQAFHYQLMAIAGSSLVICFRGLLERFFAVEGSSGRYTNWGDAEREAFVRSHQTIVDSLRTRQASGVRQAIRQHLTDDSHA